MATVDLTVQNLTPAGVAQTYAGSLSTSNTYRFLNSGRTMLHVKKSGAGSCTLTLDIRKTFHGQAVTDPTVTIPATTGDKMLYLDPAVYNDADGYAYFTLSEITGLTVAALELPA